MNRFYKRSKSLLYRLKWLSPLMGGLFPAAKHLIETQGQPMAFGQVTYNNTKLKFRNCDSSAIKEVLIDEEYKFLSDFIKQHPAPMVIDIGAHIGTFSLWIYKQNPNAKMLLIEANPSTYEILSLNIKNALPKSQYKILNKAAWRDTSTISFSTTGDSMSNKVLPSGDIKVSGITFPEVMALATKNNESIDLMKIDIEGAEEAFLENGTLEQVKHLIIELHPDNCDTLAVRKKLKKHYAKIEEVQGRISQKPLLYCHND